jgi:LacI family transcriptional regulator
VNAEIVGVDHVRAGEVISRHLVDAHGCQEVAFVGGFSEADVRHGDRETVQQRFAGVRSVIGDDVRLIRTDLTPAGAYAGVSAYLRDCGRAPQAVVAGTFGQAAATIRAVVDAGLDIPHDIRIAGFDGSAGDYGQFRLTAAQQPVEVIADRALSRLLDDESVGGSQNATPDGIEPSLRIGNSCGCSATPPIGANP